MDGEAGGSVIVDESDLNGTHDFLKAAASASDSTQKRGRSKDSRDKRHRKKRAPKVQTPLIVIDDANPPREIVSDYTYIKELTDAFLGMAENLC